MTPLFSPLKQQRKCPGWLPADLAEFYAKNRPASASPRELRDVSIHDLNQLVLSTSRGHADMGALLEAYPEFGRWNTTALIEIGRGLFGDAILYVLVNPDDEVGCIYALGPDIAGPRSSVRQPHWLLCIAESFSDWMTRLRRDQWCEYALRPGDLEHVGKRRAKELREYFSKLNNDKAWLRV